MEQKSSMDSKTIIAIVVCMAVWFGWQKYLEKKYPSMNEPVAQDAAKANPDVNEGVTQKNAKKEKAVLEKALSVKEQNLPEKTWVLEDASWKVVVSSRGGRIAEAHLKKFTQKDAKVMVLVSPNEPGLLNTVVEKGSATIDFSKTNFSLNNVSEKKIELVGTKDGVVVKKTLTFDADKYLVNVNVEVLGESLKTVTFLNGVDAPKAESQGFSLFGFSPPANHQEFFVLHKNKKEREAINPSENLKKNYEQATLAALGTRYFATIFINKGNVLPNIEAEKNAQSSDLKVIFPVLETGKTNFKFDLFVGPKSVPLLKSIDPSASQVVDYGMFYIIAHPLLTVMKWFYSIFHNWGMAIIFLTILVRLITFPFTYMAYKSTSALQRIQPEMARLKEKHKGDTQTFNTEMMKLYKENKVNPVGGCLPTLLQLPVFWALFQVLQNSIELYHAPFFGWIHDLSQKDPYYVLPVLMGIAMFFQTKLTPTTMDPAQAKMMQIMPVFFSLLMFGLPSGLTLYIFVSTVFGIIQQILIMDKKPKTGNVALATK